MNTMPATKRHGRLLRADHPAVLGQTTLFRGNVVAPRDTYALLKTGADNKKVGARVKKGKWKGMRIFTLTLEERKTCSSDCPNILRCYGNNMHLAKRIDHSHPDFLRKLDAELYHLQAQYPGGFVVRLHILGDFFSPEYVLWWRMALGRYRALRIFGYSAWDKASPIGIALAAVRHIAPDRFRLRFSNQGEANVIPFPIKARGKSPWGLVCPAQTHEGVTCASCTLCWELEPSDAVAFMEH